MDTVSIIVAIVSLCVSMLTAGWTIYRDVIQRPKFQVSIAIKNVQQAGFEPLGPDIYLEALNLGPLPNRIGVPYCRKSWWHRRFQRKNTFAFIYPNFGHMAATQTAARIEVGDTGTFVFPYDADCFLKIDWAQIGISDGYGRRHWAPRKQLRQLRKRFLRDFPPQV